MRTDVQYSTYTHSGVPYENISSFVWFCVVLCGVMCDVCDVCDVCVCVLLKTALPNLPASMCLDLPVPGQIRSIIWSLMCIAFFISTRGG